MGVQKNFHHHLLATGKQSTGTNEPMTIELMNQPMGKYGYIFKELFRLPLQLSIPYKVRNFGGIGKKIGKQQCPCEALPL